MIPLTPPKKVPVTACLWWTSIAFGDWWVVSGVFWGVCRQPAGTAPMGVGMSTHLVRSQPPLHRKLARL